MLSEPRRDSLRRERRLLRGGTCARSNRSTCSEPAVDSKSGLIAVTAKTRPGATRSTCSIRE